MNEKIRFHTEAATSFNARGKELIKKVRPKKEADAQDTSFEPDFQYSASITDDDMDGLQAEVLDDSMRAIEISFPGKDEQVCLTGSDFIELRQLSEKIRSTEPLREHVSWDFVKSTIVDWLQARLRNQTTWELAPYIEDAASAAIDHHEIWVPLSFLSIEEDISLGDLQLKSLTGVVIDRWLSSAAAKRGREEFEALSDAFANHREEIQGHAAVCVNLKAEPLFAGERALERAEDVAALIRVLHSANCYPKQAFYCRPVGSENLETYNLQWLQNGTYEGFRAGTHLPLPIWWPLDRKAIEFLEDEGSLKGIRFLLKKPTETEFQTELRDALFIYSRNTLSRNPTDKLLYIIVAVESLLLRNRSEPIQQSIGQRLAAALGKTPEEREEIIKLTQNCYEERSKFVHHGRPLTKLELLEKFMVYVWVFFLRTLKHQHVYSTKLDLLDELERVKAAQTLNLIP